MKTFNPKDLGFFDYISKQKFTVSANKQVCAVSVVYPEIVDRTVYVNLKFSKYTYTAYFNCPLDRM